MYAVAGPRKPTRYRASFVQAVKLLHPAQPPAHEKSPLGRRAGGLCSLLRQYGRRAAIGAWNRYLGRHGFRRTAFEHGRRLGNVDLLGLEREHLVAILLLDRDNLDHETLGVVAAAGGTATVIDLATDLNIDPFAAGDLFDFRLPQLYSRALTGRLFLLDQAVHNCLGFQVRAAVRLIAACRRRLSKGTRG